MVGRLFTLKPSGPWRHADEYGTLHGKGNFAGIIKVAN